MANEKNITLYERFISVLERNIGVLMTPGQIADIIIKDDPEYHKHKISLRAEQAKNQGLVFSEAKLEKYGRDDIRAEISTGLRTSYKNKFKLDGGEIFDSPRRYIYKRDVDNAKITKELNNHNNEKIDANNNASTRIKIQDEHDLYPLLTKFLFENEQIHSMRINEKTSKNNKGADGNKWLHPDIVGVKVAFDGMEFEDELRKLAHQHISHEKRFTLYSFEVKQSIASVGIAREYFFQALANSSWANYAYLVVPMGKIHQDAKDELQILMELHGVGLIEINLEDIEKSFEKLDDSQFSIKAKYKELDWQNINRLLKQNNDFKTYVEAINKWHGIYNKSGYKIEIEWDYERYAKKGLFEHIDDEE